jgi:hypothetical protein
MDRAFKKLIIDTFEDLFINALSNETVYYTNQTSLECITHLLMYYFMIAPKRSHRTITVSYDPNLPVGTVF